MMRLTCSLFISMESVGLLILYWLYAQSVYMLSLFIISVCLYAQSVYILSLFICSVCLYAQSVYMLSLFICSVCLYAQSVYYILSQVKILRLLLPSVC